MNQMQQTKIPLGIHDFRELRQGGYIYVDKTKFVERLIERGKYYFLSRPRRFGKTLLLSTIKEIFSGSWELFSGLAISSSPLVERLPRVPVILLTLTGSTSFSTLDEGLAYRIQSAGRDIGIDLDRTLPPGILLEELIRVAANESSTGQVVLLVDEYESPITESLDDFDQAREARDKLRALFASVKSLDAKILFMMITGVSKFSKTSLFSVLNHLTDISSSPDFTQICGYTEEEIERAFASPISEMATFLGKPRSDLKNLLREWYDGYSWDGRAFIYAPYSVSSALWYKQMENYWFKSGIPTFLLKLLRHKELFYFEEITATSALFEELDPERIDPISLLFQTGYLTLKEQLGDQEWRLSYPNKEVRDSLLAHIFSDYSNITPTQAEPVARRIVAALERGYLEEFFSLLNAHLASIPYELLQHRRENVYHAVLYSILAVGGVRVEVEVSSAKGRADLVAHLKSAIYVIECKLDKSPDEAIQQIKERGYAVPYQGHDQKVIALGVSFSSVDGSVSWKDELV